MIRFLASLLFAVIFFSSMANADSNQLRVGFISPKSPGHPFWGQVIEVMQAVADDLNIELVIGYDESNSTIGTKRTGDKLLNLEPKLDYLITGYWSSVTKYHLNLAQARGIKVFLFNADIKEAEKEEIGLPRGRFTNWIGHMVPDDFSAAKELTRILIAKARNAKHKESVNQNINIFAFMGGGVSSVSLKRNSGLKQQVGNTQGVVLYETSLDLGSLESWKKEWACDEAVKMLNENPNIDVIWAANHSSAWGAVQAVEKLGKIPGQDVIIGGFDWNSESRKALADGRMTASMFGHFLEGARALIFVHDHYYGYDFADDTGTRIATPLTALTADSYAHYSKMFLAGFWQKIDFRKLSKKYDSNLHKYDLNIDQFFN
ncbi:MAG: ABC transporter substrate-binding protein [Gammaproteobacteria bacterium]|nr:ABC transporter substrate-binding protein [Gammaproteobacteria bacterium]